MRKTNLMASVARAPETEGSGSTSVDTETKTVKERVAKHELIDGDGKVVESEEEAKGIRYTHLASGQVYSLDVSKLPAEAMLMLANFGAKTLATNEASQARQADNPDQIGAIRDRFELISTGKWVDRTGGERKIDLDIMAQAIVNVGGRAGKSYEIAAIRGKLDDAAFVRQVRQVKDFTNEYATLQGKTLATVDDVFANIG